ncbi:MAG: phosphoribosylformylglycinamidine cyclo-ligase [Clostridiales bacterium]|nr:MAG: phosphoribosylformylglycinamidine cyclo-ligase [Clostridiales bacterium]
MKLTYRDAGVDTERAAAAISALKGLIASSHDANVMQGIGAFGSMYALGDNVLVAGTDGVGTKLILARDLEDYSQIGFDLVGMCVNDIICHGAKPLFFLDYLAMGALHETRYATVIESIVKACQAAKVSLVGGESAEMPDMYQVDDIDLAGFCVGIVSRKKLITGNAIKAGDKLIGVASNGFHANGFTLIRKLIERYPTELVPYQREFLRPTQLYTDLVLTLMNQIELKGIAHITGGGFFENIPRVLPKGLSFVIRQSQLITPKLFERVCALANLNTIEAYSTFNMGYGMVFVVAAGDVERFNAIAQKLGHQSNVIGEVKVGSEHTIL